MKKIAALTIAALTTAILLSALCLQTASATFTDIDSSHNNYEAIIYLQENDILHGYGDGTFKPEKEVNRAEFLKIIIEGSGIETDKEDISLPFTDIDLTQWYVPYIKKAYAEGWVVGYDDGTFKPSQSINKVESLKILGEVQEWDLQTQIYQPPFQDTPSQEWYTKYIAYAQDHNYLEETGSYFYPADLMTRASISEIIYRTLTILPEIPESDTDTESDTNPNITLTDPIPDTFYQNEVYIFEGNINSENYDLVTFILNPDDENDSTKITFVQEVQNNHFEIPVHFRETGDFYIGILPGEEGVTTVEKISVLPSLPESNDSQSAPQAATSLRIDFENHKTFVDFTVPPNSLKKLHLTQGSEEITYISRQEIDSIEVYYPDFENFDEEQTSYYIETATIDSANPLEISSDFTKSSTKYFDATQHHFDLIVEDGITTDLPEFYTNLQDISFSGTINIPTQAEAYIIKPNGFVETSLLSASGTTSDYYGMNIIENGNFEFNYSSTQEGIYIVGILDKYGNALINHPLYLQDTIPLIPDYFDLNKRELFIQDFDLEELRQDLLYEINKSRFEHGLTAVSMTTSLNNLAQNHTTDMITNNFFGHINLQGQGPGDRAEEAGITAQISENIALDTSIQFAHQGLMRSPSHRSNILNSLWTSVGLGIELKDGSLYITEEFLPI
jgi:hypothetical protein